MFKKSYLQSLRCRWQTVWLLALCAPWWLSSGALAATATTTFNATATVVASCIVVATNVAFGVYSGSQLDGTGLVTATCVNGTSYTLALNVGTGSGATLASRRLTGPSSQTLTYSLYQDSGRIAVWGDVLGTDTVASSGSGIAQVYTMYGRVPASQYPSAGSYSDTISVTLTY